MSISVVFNGVTYSIPEGGAEAWGDALTSFFTAIPSGALQKTGGNFTLTGDVNFGANFGLLTKYLTSLTTLPSTAGVLRLAVSDSIGFRNNANSGNLLLALNASDQLTFNGSTFQVSGNYLTALTGDVVATGPGSVTATIQAGAIVDSKVSASAAIAFSKLATLSSGNILVGSAGNVATAVAVTGDVTISSSGVTAIGANKVTLAQLAQISTANFLGRTTASTGNVESLTATQATALLNGLVGDSGSGGTKGLVPAPAAGDAAASKFLKADGTWATPAGAGTVTSIGMTVPAELSVSPSSITTNGTFAISKATQTANTVWAGPASGAAAAPTFRAPVYNDLLPAYKAPTVQTFLQTLYYTFTTASQTVTAGATYTNNGQTFTVLYTTAAGTSLVCSATGAPTGTGTLTKASGTGTASFTFSAAVANGTYTRPSSPSPLYLKIKMAGGGGGGSGAATTGTIGSGGPGGTTTFGTSLLSALGGNGGIAGSTTSDGAGGTATVSAPALQLSAISGGSGQGAFLTNVPNVDPNGGCGGNNAFGGGGGGGGNNNGDITGKSGANNTGGGGGGGPGTSGNFGGSGGGAGGYIEAIISSPSATYTFNVGAAGSSGVSNTNGGAGGSGIIIVEEYYQ